MIDVEVIETPSLGDRSYLATDREVAVLVDPQRDVDRVLALAGRLSLALIGQGGGLDEAAQSALDGMAPGRVAPSNRWRALEVVTATELAGTRDARLLREAYQGLGQGTGSPVRPGR